MFTVGLVNPKYPHNVGAALRAAACWGGDRVVWSGDRMATAIRDLKRLPREERMKGYRSVVLERDDNFVRQELDLIPVAVELRQNSESLLTFEHPENALYVFGPEDGSLPRQVLSLCHRFVSLPSAHCLNLAAAVNVVLYDRYAKRVEAGLEDRVHVRDTLLEHRGYIELTVLGDAV